MTGATDSQGARTLAIDIGGSRIKASVLGPAGEMLAERLRVPTPHPAKPESVVAASAGLAAALPAFDRVSAGFPGVVRSCRVITAPHLGTGRWRGFPLAAALARQLGKPVRLLNDAEVQGFGVVRGRGLECVLTFGTGLGSAVFLDGRLAPHLELSRHPIRGKSTYDDYLGAAALARQGRRKWNRRVARAIAIVRRLINFDRLYLGGGNARHLVLDLAADVEIVSNEAGITGGVRLWDPDNDWLFAEAGRPVLLPGGRERHGAAGAKAPR